MKFDSRVLRFLLISAAAGACDDEQPEDLPADAAVIPDMSVGECPDDIDVDPDFIDERVNNGEFATFGGKVYRLRVQPAARSWNELTVWEHAIAANGQEDWFQFPDPQAVPPCPFNLLEGDGGNAISCGAIVDDFFVVGAAGEVPELHPAKDSSFYDYVFILSENFDILGEFNAGAGSNEEIDRCRIGCRQDFSCNVAQGPIVGQGFGLTWDLRNVVQEGSSRTDVFVNRVDLQTNNVY